MKKTLTLILLATVLVVFSACNGQGSKFSGRGSIFHFLWPHGMFQNQMHQRNFQNDTVKSMMPERQNYPQGHMMGH